MFAPSIQLALTKAQSSAELAAVQALLTTAAALDAEEASFAGRMQANKAARGASQIKVSKAKRQALAQYAADAEAIVAEQLQAFAALDRAADIIFALHMGLQSDCEFWAQAQHKAEPEDAATVQAFVGAKIQFRDALAAYLTQFSSAA